MYVEVNTHVWHGTHNERFAEGRSRVSRVYMYGSVLTLV